MERGECPNSLYELGHLCVMHFLQLFVSGLEATLKAKAVSDVKLQPQAWRVGWFTPSQMLVPAEQMICSASLRM